MKNNLSLGDTARYPFMPFKEMKVICEREDCKEPKFKSVITEYSCFGHEYMDLCKEHYQAWLIANRAETCGYCDRCGNTEGEDIRPFQDPEEGSAAAYLDTCKKCRQDIAEAFSDD